MAHFLRSLCLILLFASSAHALSSARVEHEFVSVRLLAGAEGMAALEFKLAPDWKMYWRTPGDAGISLTVDEKESVNLESLELLWPVPVRYVEDWGLEAWGYKDRLVLPLKVVRQDKTAPLDLKLKLNYSVCSDICVPFEHSVALTIPAKYKPDPADVETLKAALAYVPVKPASKNAMAAIQSVKVIKEKKDKGALRLVMKLDQEEVDDEPFDLFTFDLFTEDAKPGFRFPQPSHTIDGDKMIWTVPYEMTVLQKTIRGQELTFTLTGGDYAVQQVMTVPEK